MMRSALLPKRLARALLPALALICAAPVAVAGAHGDGHGGSVVEVSGVVTAAPSGGSGSFTATAHVVEHPHFFHGGGHGHGWGGGDRWDGGHGWGGGDSGSGGGDSASSGGGKTSGGGSSKGTGYTYTYSGKLRGHHPTARTAGGGGTPDTVITTDSSTQVRIDSQQAPVGNLAVGDYFTAVYDGTADESLSTITSTSALWLSAWSGTGDSAAGGGSLYAFVGTVSNVDTTSATISVNVMDSTPNGLFSGTDTFDVGSQTIVLGNSSSSLFGSLRDVSTGDVVAGGVIAASGESAGTIESTPLEVLVDFPQSSSSSGSSANAEKASIRRAERRALKLLRRAQATHGHHKK